MKKIITVFAISLLLLASQSFVLAKSDQRGQGQPAEQQAGAGNRGIETATQKLNMVTERNNNPETGEQIRSMVQNHEKVQKRTQEALQQMSQRNRAVKFLIGPDYKNAGQIRSDVVGLRNDINKLEKIKESSSPEDVEDVQGSIDELQAEADGLENQLAEELLGFSLFGWVAKWLAR